MTRALLSHPTGSPFARNAVAALDIALGHCDVATTLLYDPSRLLGRMLQNVPNPARKAIERELSRREWLEPGRAGVTLHPLREIIRLVCLKSGADRMFHLSPPRLADWVFRSLDGSVASSDLVRARYSLVYAFEDCALETFRAAKRLGITCFYDLPIVHHRTSCRIQSEEAERFPEFASALTGAAEPPEKLVRKDEELALADRIVAASSVTKRSLLDCGVAPERISVIPYGAPVDYFQPRDRSDNKFRALFVGRVGPRKGVHYLLEAWDKLGRKDAELKLVGLNEFPSGWLERYSDRIDCVPSVPHRRLAEIYTSASVFVFPSLVEGFGLVLFEAMACGIPVITTPNTAGPDFIDEGKDGFIIPMRDPAALCERLEWCATHPDELKEMGKAARKKAEQYPWERYQRSLSVAVKSALDFV